MCDNWWFRILWSFLLCQLDTYVRISYFTIYYLTPHVLRKRIRNYLCHPSTFPNTHFLNPMNMIVIAYYAHACHPVWLPWYIFDACLIIFDKSTCCVMYFYTNFMFHDNAWEVIQVRTLTLSYDQTFLLDILFFFKTSCLLRYPWSTI